MNEWKRSIIVPVALIGAGILFWLVVLILFAFDGEQYGTFAEWIGASGAIAIGALAAWFAALAWTEAKAANIWAAKAVAAEARTQRLMEQELASSVKFSFEEREPAITTQDAQWAFLTLAIAHDSPDVWIRKAMVPRVYGWTEGQRHDDVEAHWKDSLEIACSSFKDMHIGRGGETHAPWAYRTDTVDPHDIDSFVAVIRVTYTVTTDEEATIFASPEIPLELRDPPRVWTSA